jgi:hypothetical protein
MGLMAKALEANWRTDIHNSGADTTSGTNQRQYLKACLPMGTVAAHCKNTETTVRRRLLSSSSDKPVLADIPTIGYGGDKEQ